MNIMRSRLLRGTSLGVASLIISCEPSTSGSARSAIIETRLESDDPIVFGLAISKDGPSADFTVTDVMIVAETRDGAPQQTIDLDLDCRDGNHAYENRGVSEDLVYGYLTKLRLDPDSAFPVECDLLLSSDDTSVGPIVLLWYAEVSFVWESDADIDFRVEVTQSRE